MEKVIIELTLDQMKKLHPLFEKAREDNEAGKPGAIFGQIMQPDSLDADYAEVVYVPHEFAKLYAAVGELRHDLSTAPEERK